MPSCHFLKEEVELCTMSSEGFKVLSSKILESVAENDVKYFKEFLKQTALIITSKYCAPTSRFYALYLLFKASLELKAEFLLEFLKETELLGFIHYTAQYESTRKISLDERGRGFFTQSPTKNNTRIGVNFVRLCLEMLTYWDQRYVDKTAGHPSHLFRLYAKGLSKKLKLPQFYFFIGKSYDLSQDLATWDFSLKFPEPAKEPYPSVEHDQSDFKVICSSEESDDQLSCESFQEEDIIDEKGTLSVQTQIDFYSSAGKDSNPSQEKQDLPEEPLPPFVMVARHQSEPQSTSHLISFKKKNPENDLKLDLKLELEVDERIPSSATVSRAKKHFLTTPVPFPITKSKTYERSQLLSDLNEIGMSIKRSMNSSAKIHTSSTIEDNNNQEKVDSLGSSDEKTPANRKSHLKNASLISLRLATPHSTKNVRTDENKSTLSSSRRHFTFLNKETIPSCSSIWWDKEEQTTSNTPFHHPPALKRTTSKFANSLLDFENQAFGKAQESTRRDYNMQSERKKYDPFLREKLGESSELFSAI